MTYPPGPIGDPLGRRYTERVFDWQQIAARQSVSRELLDCLPTGVRGTSTSVVEDPTGFLTNQLIVQLRAYVLTHQNGEHLARRTKAVQWPATTWQMFKHRHASAWWLRWLVSWHPVVMDREVLTYEEVWRELVSYPWAATVPEVPSFGPPVRIIHLVDSKWTEGP